jgi:glycosyltransferase involved in cell wall biosynthesis
MKIIAISNRIPAENKNGAQLVSYHRLMHMAKLDYTINLVCFHSKDKKDDYKAKQILEKNGICVHFITWNIFEAAFNLLKALIIKDLPLQCAMYKSKKFSKKIKEIFKNNKINAIYCVMIRVAPNTNWFKGKILIEMVDSLGLNFLRRYQATTGLKKWIFEMEQKKVSIYEKELADKSYCSIVVSAIDKKNIGSSKVKVIPIGVNIFNNQIRIRNKPIIIFTGNMYYRPNIDAITWFIKYCWADILQAEPRTQLLIVGNNPTSAIISVSKKYSSIKVTGTVPSVIDMLSKARVAVAPMQSGSGMQIKILEAMSCGVPIVTTNIGFGDLKAVAGKDLFVEDSAKDFVKRVIYMIKSIKQNKVIGKNGQKYVRRYHNWKILNEIFMDFLKN